MAEKDYGSKEEVRGKPIVRCKACITRFEVPMGASEAKCPECDAEWRISWTTPDTPYVRGAK